MPKVEGSSRLGSSDLLAELKEISAVVHSMQDKKATLSIDTSDVDKAEQKIDGLDKKIQKKRKLKVETSDLTEAQKIIQEYGKGGRSKYLVSEEAMVKNLTKAYESYNKAISQSQKDKSRGDVMRWGNAYRGAGYDTKKVDKQIFDFADQVYKSYDRVDPTSGKKSNQMRIFSEEYFKTLFDAMRSEAGGNFDFTPNEKHWAIVRRDTDIGKQVKDEVISDVKQGVEDASKEKIDVPIDDILNVEIGKGNNNTIQKKINTLRAKLEEFYNSAYDKEGGYRQKSDNVLDKYIRQYSEYAEYMSQTGQDIEQRYADIYDNIHRFSRTRRVVPASITGPGQDDFAELKVQEMASAKSAVENILSKAERKAAAQLAVGVKPSAKAGEPGKDAGQKIAEGMKKAGEATQEAKEKIEQVGETGKNAGEKAASGMEKAAESAKETRQEIEQASEAAKSVAEAEKAVDTASAKKTAESHSDAAKSAEEHAGKVKEVTQSIQEEVTATQQLNAEKEKSSQQNIQDNTAQQAKENEEALHKQAEAQREVNDAKEQSNDKSKLSSASQEISQVEQMEAALDFQKKKLYDLKKQAEAVKQVYDDLQDRNEYIKARRNVKGTKDNPNPFGLDGNLDKLYEQAIDHINRKEPNMAKAAAYYGFYRNAGGKDKAVVNGEDFTSQLTERWNAIQRLNKAIREGSINVNDYSVNSLNKANEAVREQQKIVDNVAEKVRQAKKEAAEQRKEERELAAQESAESKAAWSQGLSEQEIAGVEAYLKKVKALKKEAYNETDALAKAMSLVEKIKKRDVSGLMDQFTKDTQENNALLGKITNMPVRSQKQRNAALRSINQEQYDQLIKGQTEAVVEQGMQGIEDASKNAGTSGADAMGKIGDAAGKASSQINEAYEAVEKIMHLSWNGGESFMNFDLNGLTADKDNIKRIIDTIKLNYDTKTWDDNFKHLNDFIYDKQRQLTRWFSRTDKDSGWDPKNDAFDAEVYKNFSGEKTSDLKKMQTRLGANAKALFSELYSGGKIPDELKGYKNELFDQLKNGSVDAMSAVDQLLQKVRELHSEQNKPSSDTSNRNFAADIKSLEGYSNANEDFVNQLIASVVTGQKEYDAAMEELRSHIAQRQEEIRTEQEKNLRVNTEISKFASGSKPILDAMGIAENGPYPTQYSDFIAEIQSESIKGEEAVLKFAEAFGFVYDQVNQTWARPTSRKDDFLNATIEGYKEYIDTVAGGAEINSVQIAWDKMLDQKTFNDVLDAVNKINEAFRQGKLDSEGYIEGLGRLDGMDWAKYYARYLTKDDRFGHGARYLDEAPEGWKKLEGALTAPQGYEWYSNGASRFSNEYQAALVKVREETQTTKDTIVRSQEEIQAEIERTNDVIKIQEQWMKYLGDPNAPVTSTGKRDATDQLRNATKRLANYRMHPEEFIGQMDEEKITVHWWKAMQEAQRQGVADSVISRYRTDISESDYNEALSKLQGSLALHKDILQKSKDELVQLQAELQQAASEGVARNPSLTSPTADQHREQQQSAEDAATSEEHLKEAVEAAAQAGASSGEATQQHQEQAQAAESAASAEEHLKNSIEEVSKAEASSDEAAKAARREEILKAGKTEQEIVEGLIQAYQNLEKQKANPVKRPGISDSEARKIIETNQESYVNEAKKYGVDLLAEIEKRRQAQKQATEEAIAAEENLKNVAQDTATAFTGTDATTNVHKQQEESADAAADAEEKLKGATSESQQAGSQESGATHAHREQQKAAEDAADAEDRLSRASEESARLIRETESDSGSYRTKTYELSKGLTRTEGYRFKQQPDDSYQWEKVATQDVANYNVLLQDTIKYTQLLTTAQAALKLAQEKNSGKEVTDAIRQQINYYQQMIDKNRELAESYAKDSRIKVAEGTGGLPYTKKQYDSDVDRITKEIQLKIGKQSAEQIERQQARNEAELKKNQAEIDKANNYVAQQIQRLRDIENKYDISVNAQASRGIGKKDINEDGSIKTDSNLSKFQEKVKNLEAFLEGMRDAKLDPAAMNNVITMFGELKRFGDNAYLEETAKKGDLSRQSVESMKDVLTSNIGSFLSTAKLSKGDTSGIQSIAENLRDSISGMVSGDEVSAAFTKLKELRAELKNINDEARLDQQTQKETTAQYDEYINKIKALIDARSQLNQIQAAQLKGEPSEISIDEGLDNVKNKAIEAEQALNALFEMWNKGLIGESDFDKALELYDSDEANQGSMKSRLQMMQAVDKAVKELGDSYIKLADAREKAEHSKTISGRELGRIEQEKIEARQQVLKGRLGSYADQNEYIMQSKQIASIKAAEYEEKRNAVINTKDLGFGTTDNVSKTWDVLIQKAQRYQQILYKQQSGATLTVNEKATLEKLAPLYAEAERQAEKMSEAFTKYEDKYNKMHEQIGITNDALASQTIDKYDKAIGGLEAESDSMPYMYNQQVIELKANLESLKQIDIGNQEWFDTLNKLDEGLQRIKTDREMMPFDENARVSLNRQMSDWVAKNTGAGEYRDQVMLLQQSLQNITNQADYDRIANGFNNIRAAAAEAGKTGLSFGDGLIKRFKSLGQYLLSFASFYRIIGTLKQAVSIVKELDSGLMEVRKVAQESITSLKEWQKSTFDQADVIGGNASQIEKSTAAWLRLGKSFTEAQEAAQASVKLLNVSEFENIDDATTSLVSMRQAFQDLTYEDFIDKLNGVGDNFSSSTDQLAQGMQNVSAVLKVQGNDIDQSLALLTAANDITQDMSKASMGVRTVALRIAGTEAAKEELEEYGEDVSDFVVQTASKVDAQVRGYTKTAKSPNGVSVLDESGRLRDTYDILLDIAKVYDDIVEKDNQFGTNSSNALLELLAGKTRSNILASILQNPQLLEDAYEQSKNSQGVGQRELDVYLDSIEARMAKMQNRLQELAFTALNSDFIKTFVDGLTQGLQIITKIVDVAGTLPTLLGAVGGFMLQKGGLGIGKFNKRTAKWGLGGMPGAVGGLWKKISTASGPMDNEVASYLAGYDLNQKLYGEGGALAHKNLADAPQALQQYTKEMLNVGNATVTVRDALNATSQSVTGFSGLLANAGNLAVSFFSTMGTMALAMAASWALGKIAEGIYNIINAEKNMIENGKKATDSINDRYKAYGDLKDNLGDIEKNITGEEESGTTEESISKIAEKYTELHNGVNELNNANQNLSTEKYQEYLTLCNQLAEQSPSLVSGYDAQGNAILNIGNSASEVEAALIRMYEAEKLAANVEIGENIQDSYDGLITEINKKVKENSAIKDEIKILETQIADTEVDNYGGSTYVTDNSITVSKYTSEVQDALDSVLKDVGLSWQSSIGDMSSGGEVTFIVNGLDKLDSETRNAVQQRISEVVGGAVDTKTKELASEKNEKQRLQLSNDLFIKDQQKSIQGIINKYLTTSDVFGQQSDAIQNAILNNLGALDLSVIEDKYSGEIVPYIYSELIAPISELTPDVQSKLAELFELKPENISAQEYAQKMTNIINSTFEEESDRVRWSELFGVDAAQNEINSLTSKVKDEFTDIFGNNYLTNDQLEQLFGLSLDDLRTYANLVRDNTYDTWEDLQNDFNKIKEQNIKPTDTLSDLINSDDYKTSTESLSSDLSSLTGALETLRTEGSLTAEEMVELQNSFPDLTEFTTEAIQTKAFEKLDEWISKIREGMKGMSEESKEQARTMIQNMVDQYGDLGVSVGDIMDSYVGSGGSASVFSNKFEKLKSDLAAEGLELDTHVLYTLVAQDEFSGTADQILEKYKDVKINWDLILESKELENDINRLQSQISNQQAKNSRKEANGGILNSGDYYDLITLSNGVASDRQIQYENAKRRYDNVKDNKYIDKAFKDNLYQQMVDAETEFINAQVEVANNEKSAIESQANGMLQVLKRRENDVTKAQNALTDAENKYGEGNAPEEFYSNLQDALYSRANVNTFLSHMYEAMAQANPKYRDEFMEQALSYSSSAQSDTESAKGYDNSDSQKKLNKLQEDATKIQRNLTVAEQNHQKVSKSTYNALIHNAKNQIKLLKEEQEGVKDNLSEWRNYQDQIDSLNDSIYEWGITSESLFYDQASQLASAISSAMSESISETGLTDDTINALKTAFSDLDGSKFDVSDAFYSTADGVKVNTEALQELTEAEFELIGAPLANEIANVQAQLEKDPGNSALQDKLENLMETNAKYFAQYEEMQKALSRNAAIDLAEGTENAGANYDKNYGRVKTYKEAYENGLTGTDDFKAWTSYLDVYGRDTLEAYESVSGKIDRYFTEDASEGLGNFLTDMEKLGYAAQDADGYWDLTVDDYNAAAKDMQMGSDWFMDTMRKLEDYGFIHTYVSSLNEAQLKTRDVEEQIADAVQTYSDMVARGASDEELQKQIEHINELESQWQELDTVTKTWDETTEANRRKEFLNLDDQLSAFEEMYKNADTDAGREAAKKAAQDYVKQFRMTLNEEDLTKGIFRLSDESAEDYNSRIPDSTEISEVASSISNYVGEIKKAQEWGLGEELSGGFVQSVFGNVDMNKRQIIEWTDELKQTYADALASWDYQPENGSIDTVFGGSDRFGEDVLQEGVEVAFTPIMNVDGKTEFLGKDTVYGYIESLIADSTENGKLNIDKLFELDAMGRQVGDQFVQGIVAAADESLDYGELGIGNEAVKTGMLMHFSGNYGAMNLASTDKEKLEAAGFTDQFMQDHSDAMLGISEAYQEDAEKTQGYIDLLKEVSREDLEKIGLHNDKYDIENHEAEDALEYLADKAGITTENIGELLDVLDLLGINLSEVQVPKEFETLDSFLTTVTKGSGAGYQISTDIFGQSAEQLQTQMDEIGTLELQVDPDSDVYEQLQELKKQTEIQLNIKNSEYTQEQLKEWAEAGDRQQIANTFGIDVDSEEVDQYIQQIKNTQLDYDMVIHVDDTQFAALMEAITGEPYEAKVDITADGSEAEEVAENTKKNIEKKPIIQTIQQKIQSIGNAITGFFGGGQQQQQDVQASAQLDTSKGEKELGKFNKDVSNINKTSGTATADINISTAMGKIAVLKDALNSLSGVRPMPIIDQTSINNAINRVNHLIERLNASKTAGSAIGTAHSLGTTSLSRAYAGGKDWTVGRNESALVNEIGQESRVRDGVWELIPGGPHVEDLRKDDIIFNAEQTEDLIRTGKTARRGQLVAHANGTVSGMPAYSKRTKTGTSGGKIQKHSSSSKKGNTGGGNGGNNGGNGKSSSNNKKKSEFEKWLEKLFDWIEVRLDRIQRRIDISTTKAENAIGKLDSKGQSLIGTISKNKNANINAAMRQIASNASEVSENNTYIKQKNGKVTSVKGGSANTLLGASVAGALRYQQQADQVAKVALNKNVFKSKNRKSKASQQKYMNNLISLIHSGAIDIKEYSGDVKKFIEAYKGWYDKSQDLVKSTEELRQQYKELQQTKLDNIVDEFETLVGLSEAVKASSEATVEYYKTAGRAIGTKDEKELEKQRDRQSEITKILTSQISAFKGELVNAEKVFGKNSNEYREAQTKLEEMNKSLIESQTAELELQKSIRELSFTIRGHFITRVKALVDKLGTIASLAEKRGTISVYGVPTRQTEDPYMEQTRYNNELILKYYEDIKDKQKEIQEFNWEVDSDQYEEAYNAITSDESAILSLLSANEDLKDSIRSLRWKPYEELNKELDDIVSDLQHVNSFIRDGEILDDDGQITERGYAQIALIAEQMDVAEKKIRNANAAMEKLGEERDNDVISTEEYNEALDEQIKIIQDASSSLYDDQTKLADIYIDQITKENDILQDLIQSRKEALSAKKEYYDYDKTLRSKNKDIAQLQAQINALQGVTNDAAIAKRTKLQAELAEKQEDLNDTLYNHSIDLQQEGYDKLSEDMQTALDNAINAINGKFEALQSTAASMLTQLQINHVDEATIINGIVTDNATALHASTTSIINELSGEDGVKKLIEGLGVKLGDIATLDIAGAINSRTPDSAVSNINTVLSTVQNSLGEDVEGDLREIEIAIGSLKLSEEQKNQIKSDIEKLEGIDNKTSDIKEKIDKLKEILEQSDKTLQTISGNTAKGNENVGGNVNNNSEPKTEKNINPDPGRQVNQNSSSGGGGGVKQNPTKTTNIDPVMAAIQTGTKRSNKVTKDEEKKHHALWTFLVKNTGYAPTNATYTRLAAALGVSVKNKNKITSAEKDNILKKLKKYETPAVTITNSSTTKPISNQMTSGLSAALTTTTTPKTTTKTTTTAKADPILAAINSGKARSKTVTAAEKKEHGDLWEYVAKKYGRSLTNAIMGKLASLLNVKVANKSKPTTAEKNAILKKLKAKKYAKGTKNISKDLLAWTNEDWNKIGSEMIVRPSDGAILTPLKAKDSVIPANLADNLFKWGAISPDKFITNPFVGKWSAEGGGSVTNNADYTAAPQTVEMHFDSLFHIEGNVDESVMPRLENLGKSLVNDRDFQKNVIKFVTKDFVRESKKQGIR